VQPQQHSTITTNMALAAEREAYLRLAAHSMENSRQLAPNFNMRSPKAYGGYVVSIFILNKIESSLKALSN
jgi:hypothetical protein